MTKRKVLVLGGTGEIGGRVARLCADAGHDVVGVSRGKGRRFTDLKGVKLVVGDKNDDAFLTRMAEDFAPQVVIDSVPWYGAPARYWKFFPKAENFFFCGSTGKYVPLTYFPADEEHPWREDKKVNFFNQSEMDIEMFDLCDKGFPGTVFSPTNIIGEGCVPLELWGGRDIEFYRLLKAGRPVPVPPCLNVLIQSGYNWDLASAFAKAVDTPETVRGQQYIISCKKAIPLGQFLQTAKDFLHSSSEIQVVSCEELVKLRPEIRIVHGLDFLMEHMCFDIGKAERDFGYAPKVTTEEGLVKALSWCESAGLL